MPWYAETLKRWGRRPWFAAVGRRVAPPIDRLVYRVTGGGFRASERGGLPTLILTTVGRRSGQERVTPLLFLRDGDRLVVAGSNWGQQHHPAWALNLEANPRATVQVGRERFAATGRLTVGDERAELFGRLRALWPAYETYAERSGRDIKIFVLERAGTSH